MVAKCVVHVYVSGKIYYYTSLYGRMAVMFVPNGLCEDTQGCRNNTHSLAALDRHDPCHTPHKHTPCNTRVMRCVAIRVNEAHRRGQ